MTRHWPVLSVALLLIAAAAAPAGAQTEVTDRFSRTVHLDQDGTFELANIYGTVVVMSGRGREVTIDAVKRVQRPNANVARTLLGMIDIQVTEGANRVDVRTVVPRPRNFPGSVDYTVTVPQDALVTVRTLGGNIHVTDIRTEVLKSVSGDIEIVAGQASDVVTASTVSGNLTVHGLKGRTAQLSTVTGNLHVDDLQVDRLAVRAVNGNIDYAGELARSGRYEFVTHSGDIRLMLGGTTGFELQANSFSGTVRSDFPIGRSGRAGGEGAPAGVTPRGLRGAFGDGSAMLVLRAFSGNISVGRR